MLGIHLPEKLEKRLTVLSQTTHQSKDFYIKEALENYLDEYEGIYNIIEKYKQDKEQGTLETYTFEEVMKELNIDEKDLGSEIF